MNVRDLIPWSRNERSSSVPSAYRGGEEVSPCFTLHREMNRLFDGVFNRFNATMPFFGRMPTWRSAEVVETGKDVRIAAELLGMDEKEVGVSVSDDAFVIRGEKEAHTDDKDRRFSERCYGRFERRVPLPFEVEDERAEAAFDSGAAAEYTSAVGAIRAQRIKRRLARRH